MKFLSFPRDAYSVAKKVDSGKWSRFLICLDYIYCQVRYHITSSEYLDLQFYNYKHRYRKNFLLTYHHNEKFCKINTRGFTRSKYKFYQRIPDCFSRELILAPACGEDAFLEFCRKHKAIVTKPDGGSCGADVSIFTYKNDEQAREYFSKISDDFVCEEFICQHEKMTEMSPFSVNTIRILTLLEEGEVEIISACLKTGNRIGCIADNLRKGGVGAQIDVKTGIVSTCGFDYDGNYYVNHPLSGVQFWGFNIPNWDEAIALVKRAHKRLPQCQLLGWDIAITQNGADIVEANNRPGMRLTQMADRIPKGEKVLRAIRNAEKKGIKFIEESSPPQ